MTETFVIQNFNAAKYYLYQWANEFEQCIILDNCNFTSPIPGYYSLDDKLKWECCIAFGCEQEFSPNTHLFSQINNFIAECNSYLFGNINYDTKNIFENLSSKNFNKSSFPDFYFFKPKIVLFLYKKQLKVIIYANELKNFNTISYLEKLTLKTELPYLPKLNNNISFRPSLNKDEYFDKINSLKKEIAFGNIYEINYCINFHSENGYLDLPIENYFSLTTKIPAPFSTFYKLNNNYLLSLSPERYLKKISNKLYSQPMKGTVRRGTTIEEDNELKKQLYTSQKERSENIMTVDLVRNDITRCCIPESVKVEELCGIYSFKYVHQMISTIYGELENTTDIHNIIKNTFPMGSMTGAPKIKAMQLIDAYETFKRGLFSGTIGYITPDSDFDFNVIIRSILYNKDNKYISIPAGSAITHKANANDEYLEVNLKVDTIVNSLLNNSTN